MNTSRIMHLFVAGVIFVGMRIVETKEYVPNYSSSGVDIDESPVEMNPCNQNCRNSLHDECFLGMGNATPPKPYRWSCGRANSGSLSLQASALSAGPGKFGVEAFVWKNGTAWATLKIQKAKVKTIKFHAKGQYLHAKLHVEGQITPFFELKVKTPSDKMAKCFKITVVEPYNGTYGFALRLSKEGPC